MFQIQVKRYLVSWRFPPSAGWRVWVDLDAMELGKGPQSDPKKRKAAATCVKWFQNAGVQLSAHPKYGRADIVASRQGATWIVEVEGSSSRQREQAIYSALGQLLLHMDSARPSFALAVPDTPAWRAQLRKIPRRVCQRLKLELWLVSPKAVRRLVPKGG